MLASCIILILLDIYVSNYFLLCIYFGFFLVMLLACNWNINIFIFKMHTLKIWHIYVWPWNHNHNQDCGRLSSASITLLNFIIPLSFPSFPSTHPSPHITTNLCSISIDWVLEFYKWHHTLCISFHLAFFTQYKYHDIYQCFHVHLNSCIYQHFLLLTRILLHGQTTVSLFVHLLVDIWII